MEGTDAIEEKTRLRVKLGAAEIEYEGGAASLERLIMPTVAKMIEMVESHADLQRPSAPIQIEQSKAPAPQLSSNAYDHSTNTIAVSTNASSASELAIAACAHLALVKKKERFNRKEMLDEMKSAPSFFNSNMPGNHTKTLATLTDSGRLRFEVVPFVRTDIPLG
ncbi:MAG: hypothetical protein ACKVP3_25970 [Hyphomicrobiaceae bacterium]